MSTRFKYLLLFFFLPLFLYFSMYTWNWKTGYLDRLAAMCSHVHDKGKQMVKYYGYYSNCSRGKRREKSRDDVIPAIMETQVDRKTIRKNWYA